MPQTVLTVFLSSTAQDLKAHRDAVYERLRPIPFLKCTRMEDFGALNADGVKACRDGVKDADLFVGLVGMRRGWEPPGDAEKRSITEMEHDWAKEKKCACFLHVSPDTFPVPGNLYESKDLLDRQIAFRDRVMSETVIAKTGFDTPHLMASAVVENLLTQILRDPRLTQAIQSGASGAADETLSDVNAAKLLRVADAAGVTALAADAGVDRLAIFELARRLKQSEVSDLEQAMKELSAAVDVAIEVTKQGRGGNLDDLVKDVLAVVAEKTKAGDLEGASRAAEEGFARWQMDEQRRQRDETERRERSLQSGLVLLRAGLEQDILRRDAPAAALKVAKAIELELIDNQDNAALFNTLRQRQDEFYERGRDKGTNLDLQIAIEVSQRTLQAAATPNQRAAALNDLGIALQLLGDRAGTADRLEQAVAAYRDALLVWTRESAPHGWAATQNNLGSALQILGERHGDTDRLEQAVAAYSDALLVWTREQAPLDWAMTHNNLGNALAILGGRENNTVRLEQAVAAYRDALLERTREQTPLDWAMTQNNFGNALQILGVREGSAKRLEQAVEAYRNALLERARERVPLAWATTQNNLGNALASLGQLEGSVERLGQAVAAFRDALLERVRERVPLDWATTQNNLGNALQILGKRESNVERFEQAVAAYRSALDVFDETKAFYYADATRQNLSRAEAALASLRSKHSKK